MEFLMAVAVYAAAFPVFDFYLIKILHLPEIWYIIIAER